VRTLFVGRERCRFQLNVRHSARRWLEICQRFVGVNDALFLILMCWGENPFFVVLVYPFSMLHRSFGRGFQKRKLPRISRGSVPVIWPMLGSFLASVRDLDDHERGWGFDAD